MPWSVRHSSQLQVPWSNRRGQALSQHQWKGTSQASGGVSVLCPLSVAFACKAHYWSECWVILTFWFQGRCQEHCEASAQAQETIHPSADFFTPLCRHMLGWEQTVCCACRFEVQCSRTNWSAQSRMVCPFYCSQKCMILCAHGSIL